MSFSQPPLYPTFSGNNYNPATFPSASSSGLSYQSALGLFVSYPQAQGKITLLETNITGNLRTSNNIFLDNSGNYIQFPDGTKQTTAPSADDPNTVYDDVSNNFSKLNTFNGNIAIGGVLNTNYLEFPDGSRQYSAPVDDINTVYNDISNTFLSPTIQKFQGSNATTTTTAPLQFTNVSTGEYGSLFVDPNPNNDLTIYSNQAGGGLTVSNSTNSFTINPTSGNVATFLNPISSSLGITGGTLGVNNFVIFPNSQSTGISNYSQNSLNPLIYFALNDASDNQTAPLYIYYNSIQYNVNLNMNNNPIYNTNNITFSDGTGQTTAFTTSLLSPYAPLSSPVLTGNPTISTTPLNTSLSSIANVDYVNQAVAGSIPVLSNYAQLTYSSSQTFSGQVNFTGGLQKNGLSVATISQLPVITATTLSITGGSCTLNSGSFQQAVQTYYSNSGASLGTFLNYPIVFTINSYVAVGQILVIFSFSPLPYPSFPPTNSNFSITGTNNTGLVMPMDGQFYLEGGIGKCTLFMPYHFGTGNSITINFASLGNLVG